MQLLCTILAIRMSDVTHIPRLKISQTPQLWSRTSCTMLLGACAQSSGCNTSTGSPGPFHLAHTALLATSCVRPILCSLLLCNLARSAELFAHNALALRCLLLLIRWLCYRLGAGRRLHAFCKVVPHACTQAHSWRMHGDDLGITASSCALDPSMGSLRHSHVARCKHAKRSNEPQSSTAISQRSTVARLEEAFEAVLRRLAARRGHLGHCAAHPLLAELLLPHEVLDEALLVAGLPLQRRQLRRGRHLGLLEERAHLLHGTFDALRRWTGITGARAPVACWPAARCRGKNGQEHHRSGSWEGGVHRARVRCGMPYAIFRSCTQCIAQYTDGSERHDSHGIVLCVAE